LPNGYLKFDIEYLVYAQKKDFLGLFPVSTRKDIVFQGSNFIINYHISVMQQIKENENACFYKFIKEQLRYIRKVDQSLLQQFYP